nr:MAG TPA: hypothetical protein [Caudoviricetes sp.]
MSCLSPHSAILRHPPISFFLFKILNKGHPATRYSSRRSPSPPTLGTRWHR